MACGHEHSQLPSECQEYTNLLTQEELDGEQGNDFPFMPTSIEELQSTRIHGRFWSSKGFKSYISTKHAKTLSSLLDSSWVRRLAPASHRMGLMEINDTRSSHLDVGVAAHGSNQFNDLPAYQNSRSSSQVNDTGPHAVAVVTEQRSSGFGDHEGGQPVAPQKAILAPRLLPTVVALLPGYSTDAHKNPHLTEKGSLSTVPCTSFSSVMKQAVLSSAGNRVKVSCSAVEGLDIANVAGPKPLDAGENSHKPPERIPKPWLQGPRRCCAMWERASTNNGIGDFVDKSSCNVYNGSWNLWTTTQKRLPFQPEDSLSGSETNGIRPRPYESIGEFESTPYVGFPSVCRTAEHGHKAQHFDENKHSRSRENKKQKVGMCYSTSNPGRCYKRGNVASILSAEEDHTCRAMGEVEGDAAHGMSTWELDGLLKGIHPLHGGELEHQAIHVKANRSRCLSGLRMDLMPCKFCACEEFKITSCTEGCKEGSDSSSEAREEIEDYTLPRWHEKSQPLPRHSLAVVKRKRAWDHVGPSPNRLHFGPSLPKHKMWMQRLSAQTGDSQIYPCKAVRSVLLCSDNSKHDCNDGCYDAAKEDNAGSLSVRQCLRHCGACSYFLMRPCAAAMAIVGATARQLHNAHPV